MPIAPSPLIARSEQQQQLRGALDRVAESSPVVVDISGEAGIGKTSLLDWLAEEARRRHFKCLRAAGMRWEQDHPFSVLVSLFDDAFSRAECVAALDAYDIADLASALPGMRPHVVGGYADKPFDLLRVARAVQRAASRLTREGSPVLLIIDDLHWVDDATAFVVGYLVRHGTSVPMVLATAHQPLVSARQAISTTLESARLTDHIALQPINREDAAALLTDLTPPQREAVLEAAQGNPFFLSQLANDVRSGAEIGTGEVAERSAGYPPAITSTILRYADRLPPQALALAQAGAVLGDPFHAIAAGRLIELDETSTLAGLDDLVAIGWVVATETQGKFQFRHSIVAAVIYGAIAPGWRLDLHARAARMLAADASDPIQLARHIERSAKIGDVHAIDQITKVATGVAAYSPAVAARLLGFALELAPDGSQISDRRPALLNSRADCLIRLGELHEARELLQEALLLIPTEEHTLRVGVATNFARVRIWLGDVDAAVRSLNEGLQSLPNDALLETFYLEAGLLLAEAEKGNGARMRELGASVIAGAQRLNLPYYTFVAEAFLALGELCIGNRPDAETHLQAAIPLADQFPDAHLYTMEALLPLIESELMLLHWEDGLRHAERGLVIAKELQNNTSAVMFGLAIASALTGLGRLGQALEVLDDVEEIARMVGRGDLLCLALARRATAASVCGDQSSAKAAAVEAEAYLDLAEQPKLRAMAAALIAALALEAGRPDRCVELIVDSAGESLDVFLKDEQPLRYETLAYAELARGDIDGARRWALSAQNSTVVGSALSECFAHRASASVALAANDFVEATTHANAAVAAAAVARSPVELARALIVHGRALAASGLRNEAISAFERAREAAVVCGALAISENAMRELRSLGIRMDVRSGHGTVGLRSLSIREREIADLAAEGLTNQQIASRLFISPRTVEAHLRRVFAKLEVESRTDIPLIIRREQVAGRAFEQ